MFRRIVAIASCAGLLVTAAPLTTSAATRPLLDARIAKTNRAIHVFGTFEPARPKRSVRVKLARDAGTGFELVARKKVGLNGTRDADGDGRKESTFEASFPRPKSGTCRVVAIFRRAERPSIRDEEIFACGIPTFGAGEATITGDHDPVAVDLLVAENDEQRAYGLSFRRRLAAERGMVFLFPSDTSGQFWMKNTLIPLSIAFFDAQGVIVDILDMEPCLEEQEPCPTYGPSVPYRGALEVNQGAFGAWQVEVGDRVEISR